jgi:hypothetical protein
MSFQDDHYYAFIPYSQLDDILDKEGVWKGFF